MSNKKVDKNEFDSNTYDAEDTMKVHSRMLELLFAKYISDSKDPISELESLERKVSSFGQFKFSSFDGAGVVAGVFLNNVKFHLKTNFSDTPNQSDNFSNQTVTSSFDNFEDKESQTKEGRPTVSAEIDNLKDEEKQKKAS